MIATIVLSIILLIFVVAGFFLLDRHYRSTVANLTDLVSRLQDQNEKLVNHNEQLVGHRFDYQEMVYKDQLAMIADQKAGEYDADGLALETVKHQQRDIQRELDLEAIANESDTDDYGMAEEDLEYLQRAVGE